ncbi:hypothetical protein ACU6ZM_24465 [Klebsiella aerogenes]
MNNTHDSGVVLHHIATLQAAAGSLAARLRDSAGREDASLSEHLPYLREIIVQAMLFGLAYQQHAPQALAEETTAGAGPAQHIQMARLSGETKDDRAPRVDDHFACVLACMTGLFGSIAEIINREPGPLRVYAAPLDQIVVNLVMLGAVDLEDTPETGDEAETEDEECGDD